ncbi:MAG: ATP-binding protein [Firmicutes bacterium]|nr:ATP-binding protein [Bacillota bacterium]
MFKSIRTRTMFYLIVFAACFLVVMSYLVVFGIETISKDLKETSMKEEIYILDNLVEQEIEANGYSLDLEEDRDKVYAGLQELNLSENCFLINEDSTMPYKFDFKGDVYFQETYKNQRSYITSLSKVDGQYGWYVGLEQLYSDAYGDLNLLKTITIILLVLTLILLWNLAKQISYKIQEPVKALADAANNVVEGDISKGIDVNDNGELSDIANSFNLMLDKLKETMTQVLEKSGEVTSMAEVMQYVERTYENLPTGVIGISPAGEITTFNKVAEDLTGIKHDDIIGINVSNPVPYGISVLVDSLKKCINEGSILLKTLTDIKNVDGENITVVYSIRIQFGANEEVMGAICIFQKIDDIKRFEESANRVKTLESLGEMAASLAHEIRNPLTSIKGYAQLLQLDYADAEELDIIIHEVNRLNDMLNRFLNFARPKNPDLKPCNVNDLIDYSVGLIKGSKPDNVEIRVEKKDVPYVMLDRELMEPVLLNLLLNAIQALPDGGLIEVSSKYYRTRNMVGIKVKDNGIGIPAENSARLFDPFFTTRAEGTGMGLPIAVRNVEAHGGVMEVESVEGEMTQFKILLEAINHKESK